MKIIVLNGPNLNLLGQREPSVYGTASLDEIVKEMRHTADTLDMEIDDIQSNDEGEIVTRIGSTPGVYDGIIINPAAYTHTSVAIRDALQAVDVPCVEVHLSNIYSREEFRHTSLTAPACIGQISGFGANSYILAMYAISDYLKKTKNVCS